MSPKGRSTTPASPRKTCSIKCFTARFARGWLVKDLLFRQAHDLIPSLSEKLDALCELGIDNVIAILRLGQKQGIFREDLDVPTTATLLQDLSLAFFVLHDTDRPDRDEIMNKRRDAALSLVLHGIRS